MSDINKLVQFIQQEFNRSLKLFPLPNKPEYLYDPIRYAIKGEGKRFRPILVHLSGKVYKTDPDIIMKISLAVEFLHCFTLIHDDIMDSDNLRRNMPTLHHQFDISSAILAGDGMFTISQLVLNGIENKPASLMQYYNETVLEICEGQALDKHFEDLDDISIDMYTEMVEKKTGALLGACFYLPAVISGKSNNEINRIKYIGRQLGIAFQIQDDLFELFKDENAMGKSLGSDIFSNKKTIIAIEAQNINKTEWGKIIHQFDGKDLENIRNFLLEYNVKEKVEILSEHYFNTAYDELSALGLDKNSDIYKFFKMIQERHS